MFHVPLIVQPKAKPTSEQTSARPLGGGDGERLPPRVTPSAPESPACRSEPVQPIPLAAPAPSRAAPLQLPSSFRQAARRHVERSRARTSGGSPNTDGEWSEMRAAMGPEGGAGVTTKAEQDFCAALATDGAREVGRQVGSGGQQGGGGRPAWEASLHVTRRARLLMVAEAQLWILKELTQGVPWAEVGAGQVATVELATYANLLATVLRWANLTCNSCACTMVNVSTRSAANCH
jgi:hypothetical protein